MDKENINKYIALMVISTEIPHIWKHGWWESNQRYKIHDVSYWIRQPSLLLVESKTILTASSSLLNRDIRDEYS